MPGPFPTKVYQQRRPTRLGWVEVQLGSLTKGKECQGISAREMEKISVMKQTWNLLKFLAEYFRIKVLTFS